LKTIFGFEKLKTQSKKSIVSIGVFDGVHKGHQRIIETAVKDARALNGQSVVITFEPHPLEVLDLRSHPLVLTSLELKERLIGQMEVNLLLVIKFTPEFARMSAKSFVDKVLIDKLNLTEVVVGEGFKFGSGSEGDINFLTNYGTEKGFKVKSIPLMLVDNKPISSTRIRELLELGKIAKAVRILGHYPKLIGIVTRGCGRGKDVGFCTANIKTEDKASVPCDGVYAGFAKINSEKKTCLINIGSCPTFHIEEPRIEVHIIDFNENIYGERIEIEIVEKLREQIKFENKEALAVQIGKDINRTKELLS